MQVPGEVLSKVPESVSMEAASTLGCAGLTAALALFESLKLPSDNAPEHAAVPVLVYGASSSVGVDAVGLLRAAGYTAVAVASARSHKWLKDELGASQAYDYNDDGWTDAVAAANPGMAHALDCIGGAALALNVEVLKKSGSGAKGAVVSTDPSVTKPEGAECEVMPIYVGALFQSHRSLITKYAKLITELVAEGKLPLTKVRVVGGLEEAAAGLEELQAGKVRGEKLVVKV